MRSFITLFAVTLALATTGAVASPLIKVTEESAAVIVDSGESPQAEQPLTCSPLRILVVLPGAWRSTAEPQEWTDHSSIKVENKALGLKGTIFVQCVRLEPLTEEQHQRFQQEVQERVKELPPIVDEDSYTGGPNAGDPVTAYTMANKRHYGWIGFAANNHDVVIHVGVEGAQTRNELRRISGIVELANGIIAL